ncbi:MAG: HU family DNA-binding protein [Bacteroidales bacterium]|nr:HU family DNA-binding protein [Bacteroidales bacterium]MDD4574872.1 HU family DNA-binding protein [Bacteroidales bacterium]
MNKAELIDAMAEKAGLTKVQTKSALSAFMETVGETLASGERIALVGFGTFTVNTRAERKGRNPRTKQEMIIPAKNVVKFKAGNELSGQVK